MRAELIGHFEPCMTEIYIHIDARMADYIRTHLVITQLRDPLEVVEVRDAVLAHFLCDTTNR